MAADGSWRVASSTPSLVDRAGFVKVMGSCQTIRTDGYRAGAASPCPATPLTASENWISFWARVSSGIFAQDHLAAQGVGIDAGLAEDGLDTGVGVLQVGAVLPFKESIRSQSKM